MRNDFLWSDKDGYISFLPQLNVESEGEGEEVNTTDNI
jgi:hypothetical protein